MRPGLPFFIGRPASQRGDDVEAVTSPAPRAGRQRTPVPLQRWHFTTLSPFFTRPLPSQFLHFCFFLMFGPFSLAMLISRAFGWYHHGPAMHSRLQARASLWMACRVLAETGLSANVRSRTF